MVKGSSNQRRAVAVAREVANIRNSTSDKLFFEKKESERERIPLSPPGGYTGLEQGAHPYPAVFPQEAANTHTDTDFAAVEGDSEEL